MSRPSWFQERTELDWQEIEDRHTERKLGSGGLGSLPEKSQHPRISVCFLHRVGGEAGLLYAAEQGSRLLHSNKKGDNVHDIPLGPEETGSADLSKSSHCSSRVSKT